MLNAQFRRNLQQNQITPTLTVRPELFIAQAEIAPGSQEPRDVFVPRDPTLDQPVAPERRVTVA